MGVMDLTAQLLKIFHKLRHLITASTDPAQHKEHRSLSKGKDSKRL